MSRALRHGKRPYTSDVAFYGNAAASVRHRHIEIGQMADLGARRTSQAGRHHTDYAARVLFDPCGKEQHMILGLQTYEVLDDQSADRGGPSRRDKVRQGSEGGKNYPPRVPTLPTPKPFPTRDRERDASRGRAPA